MKSVLDVRASKRYDTSIDRNGKRMIQNDHVQEDAFVNIEKITQGKNLTDTEQTMLEYILDHLDTSRKDSKGGMSYEDYLRVLLIAKGKQEKVIRGMDMIECSIREKRKRPGFRMDHCIVALEASADVKANNKKTFTVTRQYAYE